MKTLRYLTILLLGTAVVSCTCEKPQQAKNVIFLIGDGMGFGAVSSLLLSEDDSTAFEQAPVIGLSETCSADNFVTDSPPAARPWQQAYVHATAIWVSTPTANPSPAF